VKWRFELKINSARSISRTVVDVIDNRANTIYGYTPKSTPRPSAARFLRVAPPKRYRRDPPSRTGSGPSAKAGKWDRSDVANKVPKGFVNEEDEDDGEPIEEADKEETTDDLQETFNRRQAHLYERLIKRWAR